MVNGLFGLSVGRSICLCGDKDHAEAGAAAIGLGDGG